MKRYIDLKIEINDEETAEEAYNSGTNLAIDLNNFMGKLPFEMAKRYMKILRGMSAMLSATSIQTSTLNEAGGDLEKMKKLISYENAEFMTEVKECCDLLLGQAEDGSAIKGFTDERPSTKLL